MRWFRSPAHLLVGAGILVLVLAWLFMAGRLDRFFKPDKAGQPSHRTEAVMILGVVVVIFGGIALWAATRD